MMKALVLMLSAAIIAGQCIPGVKAQAAADNSITALAKGDAVNGYITRDPVYDLNDREINRAESEHFQIIWGNEDSTGTVNRELVEGNLENLENIRFFYVNILGMNDPCSSMTGQLDGKYKTNLYIANTGLSRIESDWAYMSVDAQGFAYMVMNPGALRVDPPSWVVPHEYGHVVTYHMGGGTANGWYEAVANWFRDQYLGSPYYKYGTNTYGPDADFFGPLVFNSDWYFPHTKNWYDAWPILLYITENPDHMQGLGLDLMKKILRDSSTGSMFDKIERLSQTPLKEILGGYSKRMATYDFKRQDRYKVRLKELLQDGSHNTNEIYTNLERQSDGTLRVPYNRAPMQAGYNIDPLDVDLNARKVTVNFKGDRRIKGADYRVTIAAETNSGETRYSTTWSEGENSVNLQGDEKKVYLVVCAAPDNMQDLDIFSSNEGTRYPYSIKVSTSYEEIPSVPDKPAVKDSEVLDTEASFNSDAPEDVNIRANLNGNDIASINLGKSKLKKGKDYKVAKETSWGEVISFDKNYLKGLKAGSNKFKVNFTNGNSKTVTIKTVKKVSIPEEPPIPGVSKVPENGKIQVSSKDSSSTLSSTMCNGITIMPLDNNVYDLSKLKVRYYFTAEGSNVEKVWIDSAAMSFSREPWYLSMNGQTKAKVYTMISPKEKADHYVEYTFDSKEVLDSSASLYIGARIAKDDWSGFNFSNDYSYKNVQGIVVYYDNKVLSGVEP